MLIWYSQLPLQQLSNCQSAILPEILLVMNFLFNEHFYGNPVLNWLTACAILGCLLILIGTLKAIFLKKARLWTQTTSTGWDDYVLDVIERSIVPLLYIGAVYITVGSLSLPEKITFAFRIAFLASATFFVLRIVSSAFRKFVFTFLEGQQDSLAKQKQASGLILIVNIVIWIFGIIFMIDNLGYNVTSLIAGLGIGGIAIALAAQTILGDLFSYFVIFFDRPFEIGDFVVIDDKSGIVEYIGIKTTRLRTLTGEQLVCSNTDLTNARLHNYKRLQHRRILFSLGVTYQTSHDQLAGIPELLKTIIKSKQYVRFDRAHFSGFGDFSLNFEIVYYILDPDYSFYMDRQQEIYLDIFHEFENQGIEFAYPTQTVFVNPEHAH